VKSFIIAWKDFTIRLKDRKGFMLMILMPLLLTAILGAALGGVMGDASTTFPKTTVGFFLQDQDPLSKQFINEVLQSKDLKPYIKVKKEGAQKTLEDQIKNGSVDVALVFPKGWSQDLKNGKLKNLKVLADPGKSIQSDIVQSLAKTYSDRVETVAVATKDILTQPESTSPSNMAALSQSVVKQLRKTAGEQLHSVKDQSIGKKSVSGMQYYAAAMAAMFLLYNMTVGAKSFLNERDTQTLARLLSTPVSKTSILLGKFLGTLYFAVVQFFIFVFATHFLFGVDWGSNTAQTLAIGLSFAIAVSGLSMLIASLIKTEKSADLVGGMGVQILAILGGSMVPITTFPDVLRKVAHIAPNTWALTSFVDIMSGTSWLTLLLPIGVLILFGVAAITIGTWRLQARSERENL
jgi:ABC-2 type transport system permease protein